MKVYRGNGIVLHTYKRGGYFIIRIEKHIAYYAATRSSSKPHVIETGWSVPEEKKFEQAAIANRYFQKIKADYQDLVMVEDRPNAYISHDGKEKTY